MLFRSRSLPEVSAASHRTHIFGTKPRQRTALEGTEPFSVPLLSPTAVPSPHFPWWSVARSAVYLLPGKLEGVRRVDVVARSMWYHRSRQEAKQDGDRDAD